VELGKERHLDVGAYLDDELHPSQSRSLPLPVLYLSSHNNVVPAPQRYLVRQWHCGNSAKLRGRLLLALIPDRGYASADRNEWPFIQSGKGTSERVVMVFVPSPRSAATDDYTTVNCGVCAIARFARSIYHPGHQPGVPLRSTPGFTLPPATRVWKRRYLN